MRTNTGIMTIRDSVSRLGMVRWAGRLATSCMNQSRLGTSVLGWNRPSLNVVQGGINVFGNFLADSGNPCNFRLAGPGKPLQTAEMAEKFAPAFGADTWNVLQHRRGSLLLPPRTMAGDSETVSLVANMLDQMQRRGIPLQPKPGARIFQKQGFQARVAGFTVGDAENLHTLDLQVRQHLPRLFQLALATVDDQHVGQLGLAFFQSGVAALQCLVHGGVIVAGLDVFNIEAAVLGFHRPGMLEYHTAGYGA